MPKENDLDKKIRLLSDRVERLERLLTPKSVSPVRRQAAMVSKNEFGGPTGGVRLLFKEGFFKVRRQLSDVMPAMSQRGYHYSSQAVHEALKRLSAVGGPLVSLKKKKGGRRTYAERK